MTRTYRPAGRRRVQKAAPQAITMAVARPEHYYGGPEAGSSRAKCAALHRMSAILLPSTSRLCGLRPWLSSIAALLLSAVALADSVPFWGAKASVPVDTPFNQLKKGQ